MENLAPLAQKSELLPRKDTFPGLSLLVTWKAKQPWLCLGSYNPTPRRQSPAQTSFLGLPLEPFSCLAFGVDTDPMLLLWSLSLFLEMILATRF